MVGFWTDEPTIIYKKYFEFIPTKSMSRDEQLNAITRLCIYYIIILVITQKYVNWIQIPILIIVLIIIYNYSLKKKEGLTEDAYKLEKEDKAKRVVEAGYYDSDNRIRIDKFMEDKNGMPNYISDNISMIENKECLKPNKENPFMNPNIIDYETGNVPKPCNVDDNEVKFEMKKCFDEDMFKSLDDVYDKKNSERQFYTIPRDNFMGNNADFAHFLYHNTGGCRGPEQRCNRYEDLRFSTLQL